MPCQKYNNFLGQYISLYTSNVLLKLNNVLIIKLILVKQTLFQN